MIRIDNAQQWADTRLTGPSSAHGLDDAERDERHDMLTAAPKIVRNGLDYQGRAPEAAHAASEYEDDTGDAGEGIVRAIGWAILAWCLVAAILVGAFFLGSLS